MKEYQNDYLYIEKAEYDIYLFHQGNLDFSYKFLGSHPYIDGDGKDYVRFVVWAPHAKYVNLVGDFNEWHNFDLPLRRIDDSDIWEISVYGVKEYDAYKYRIVGPSDEIKFKADPYAVHAEERPKSASKYYDIDGYEWNDSVWRKKQQIIDKYNSPMSIYELNLSSWSKKEDGSIYSYRELAEVLVSYVKEMNFTHVEFMPLTEYPFDGSWGYQATGYFAATSRFGTPKDLMYLIDTLHQNNIGVIMDWVPVHFCKDDFGLQKFDGTALFESSDSWFAENEQWGTMNFDYSKPEVVNFLISSALFWNEYFHLDGLRVDAVAYMIYLDFGKKEQLLTDNRNVHAIEFIKKLNSKVFQYFPNTMMIAEESTSWPLMTMPVSEGGLGFNFKWNMGWMNDTLKYMKMDPIFRKDHHNKLTFSMMYAFSENFVLPLSHDEVVHMKGSIVGKMPGYYDQKFDQVRLLYAFMYAHPGKKLLFMGDEIGQFDEWDEWSQVTWNVLEFEKHAKIQSFVKELNTLYKKENCLYSVDTSYDGFEWEDVDNRQESVIVFERINKKGEKIICAFNFTPVDRKDYPIGVDFEGLYSVKLNTNMEKFGGQLKRNKPHYSKKIKHNGRDYMIRVDLAAHSALFLKLNRTSNRTKLSQK